MPLQRRLPKFGFKNFNRVEYKALSLGAIQTLIETSGATVVDIEALVTGRLIKSKERIKVLSDGELTSAVEIHAHGFSKSAVEAIEKAGGKAIVL